MNWLRRLIISCAMACSIPSMSLHCSIDFSSLANETIDPCLIWSLGNKHFTTTFYPYLINTSDNVVFSPISLQLGLAMTAELAVGATQQEILEKAVVPSEEYIRRMGVEKILTCLNTNPEDEAASVQLNLTNGTWLSSKISFHSSLKHVLSYHYQSELQQAHFHFFPEETRQEINSWVEENTHHHIQNLLPQGSIDKQTQMVLVNTLYMHAPWAQPFNPEITYEALFYGIEKSQSIASYMHAVGKFKVLQENNKTIIELPFKHSASDKHALSLFIVLPQHSTPLTEVEKQLTTSQLNHWIAHTKPAYIDLSLPKFKVSSSLNAKEVFQKMGMQRPFSYAAEFDLSDEHDHVMITDIMHQAVFEVDEQGGTGSAATAIVIGVKSCQEIPKRIVANRPFLIFVADKTSGVILFAGRIMQPKT